MKYASKKLPNSSIDLEVTLDHQEFLNYWQAEYDRALAAVQIKGFRPGTAPKEMADAAIDKEKVFHEAASKAIQDNLKTIIEENNWQLIDQTKAEVLESSTGLKFKATITIFPEVILGEYQKVVRRVLGEKKPLTVTEEEVEKAIQWVLNSRAKLILANRPAKMGDVVSIEFQGSIDGGSVEGASGKSDQFVLGEGRFVPGFEDQIVGHKEGEQLEFSVTLPKDYWKKDLQDKKVDFRVSIKSVFDRQLPELTDEFVGGLGKFKNVAAFRVNLRDGLLQEKEEKEKDRLHLKMLDEIVNGAKIEIPQIMLDKTLDNLVEEHRQFLRSESDSEIRKSLTDKARANVASSLVLYQISKEQKLEPTPQEVEEEANRSMRHLPQKEVKNLDPQKIYDYNYGIVRNRKVFEYLESL